MFINNIYRKIGLIIGVKVHTRGTLFMIQGCRNQKENKTKITDEEIKLTTNPKVITEEEPSNDKQN